MNAAALSVPFTLLCRLYEQEARTISNSYALKRKFGPAKSNN
jgi:hypothetical protein